MGSSLAPAICETSQVLLVGGQVFFLGDLPFLPHLKTDLAQMSEIILKGRKTKKRANICTSVAKSRNGSSFQSLLCLFKHATLFDIIDFFGLISVLRPVNTFYVISGVVSYPNHTVPGQAFYAVYQYLVHILPPVTDKCSS